MAELSEGLSLGARFRLVGLLGTGGMGEVWQAHDLQQNRQVALKILRAELADQQGFIDLLKAECDALLGLVHPNIVRVYAFHDDGGHQFISMELVEGRSLKQLRGRGWDEIVQAILPLIDALEYSHRAGIVHRDIKPGNVILDATGQPRLMDFGVASLLDADGDRQLRTGGSLPAMSPQQLAGERPSVSDDVYAFGSLLYDLISGAPLFTPDISELRVRNAEPPSLAEKVKIAIPDSLDRLIAAMLDKQPERRPPGMGAVRAALEELLADRDADEAPDAEQIAAGGIRPVTRRRNLSEAPQSYQSRPLADSAQTGGPGRFVYAGLALLAIILVAVLFVLPNVVDNNGGVVPVRQEEAAPAVAPPSPAEEAVTDAERGSRELADQALADVLELTDTLESLAVEVWGGKGWQAARELVSAGDEAYKDRLYGTATESYRQGLLLMQPLESRSAEVLQSALADGLAALEDGNQLLALERFDLALSIDANNSAAQAGRERALQLDKVLALMERASAYEFESELQAALQSYEEVLALDPQWNAAQEGKARVTAAIAGNSYQSAMSQGYAALAAKDYAQARISFNAALAARPGDANARAAIAQLDGEQKLARILSLSAEAERYAAQENWTEAAASYEAVLKIDANVLAAARGLEDSRQRIELDNRLRGAIASPDRLADDEVWQGARRLLDYAQQIDPAGPLLTGQISELDRLLQRARVRVEVRFESDSETDVVIYKVGKLGRFQATTLELKPGSYTAVGVRSGYRDVRRSFRVAPETVMQPIDIRCEDPI